jgi:hypothetical protein
MIKTTGETTMADDNVASPRTHLLETVTSLRRWVDTVSQFWPTGNAPSELFHYTSPEGFIGIITSKTLWASDMMGLNDASEVEYPLAVVNESLEASGINISGHARERFSNQLVSYMFRFYQPYVTCFCENGDLLSQWRAYGGGGEGFSLGFRLSWLLALEQQRLRLQKVIYNHDQQIDLLLMFFNTGGRAIAGEGCSEQEQGLFWQDAAASLAPLIIMFKNPAFQEEAEWRVVNSVPRNDLHFRRSGHRIVPYIEIPIGDAALGRVIRGPYFRGTEQRGTGIMLRSNRFMSAQVEESKIPLNR